VLSVTVYVSVTPSTILGADQHDWVHLERKYLIDYSLRNVANSYGNRSVNDIELRVTAATRLLQLCAVVRVFTQPRPSEPLQLQSLDLM
jgi:hypothetical protein